MDVDRAIRDFGRGAIDFDALKAQFEQATFTVWQSEAADWGDVWTQAEELPATTDAPSILNAAESARVITPQQHQELIEIYRRNVTGGEPGS